MHLIQDFLYTYLHACIHMDTSHVNCLVGTTTYRVNKHDIFKAI